MLWFIWDEYLRDALHRRLGALAPAFGVLGGLSLAAGVVTWIAGVEDLPVTFFLGGAGSLAGAVMAALFFRRPAGSEWR